MMTLQDKKRLERIEEKVDYISDNLALMNMSLVFLFPRNSKFIQTQAAKDIASLRRKWSKRPRL